MAGRSRPTVARSCCARRNGAYVWPTLWRAAWGIGAIRRRWSTRCRRCCASACSRSPAGEPVLGPAKPDPGKTPSGAEVRTLLKHLVRRIRRHWPRTRLTFRGDSHYGRTEAMAWCGDNGVDYIFRPVRAPPCSACWQGASRPRAPDLRGAVPREPECLQPQTPTPATSRYRRRKAPIAKPCALTINR